MSKCKGEGEVGDATLFVCFAAGLLWFQSEPSALGVNAVGAHIR